MTVHPNSALGRFVAVGLVVIVAGLVWLLVLEPITGAFAERWEVRADLQTSLMEYHRRSASLNELTRQRDELLGRQAGQTGLLTEANAALAGAALQATARRILEANGSALRSLQALPVRPEKNLQRVAVRVDTTAPSVRLLDLLYAIDTASPYLFIENIDLRVPDNLPRDGVGHAQIALRAEIAAYRRAETP